MRESNLYSIFGLTVASDYPFVSPLLRGCEPPDLTFTCVQECPVPESWQGSRPILESPYRFETGESVFSLYRQDDYEVLHFAEVMDFYFWPNRIVCHLLGIQ